MPMNISNAGSVLKVRYQGPVREQLNQSTFLLSRIEREDDVPVSGKSFTVPLHSSRNVSAGSGRADGGTLPTAGNQGYDVAVIPEVYQYTRSKVTGPTIKATRDNIGAFVRAVESEVDGCTRDMRRSFNRQLHSDGRDPLAFWTAADDASGTDVDDGKGNGFVHLQSGAQTVDIIDVTDNSTKLGDSIVLTLGAAGTNVYAVTWTGTVSGSADGDYAVMEDTLTYQLMGLKGIVSTANPPLLSGGLHGLPVATKTFWVAQNRNNSGTNRTITVDLMQQVLDDISTNSNFSEEDVKFGICSPGVRRAYFNHLRGDRIFVNTMEMDGGFKFIPYNGIPIVSDPQANKNQLYFVVPEVARIYRSSDFSFMDEDGSMLMRVAGEDSYEMVLFHYGNFGTTARNAHGLLDDVTEG